MSMTKRLAGIVGVALPAAIAMSGCGGDKANPNGGQATSIEVKIDGSSTVAPISQAMAEEFQNENKEIHVTVAISGTGGGFKKFVIGETDISDASRPIKQEEQDTAKSNGIEFIELPVGYDGLSVVVNPQNDWVDHLTIDELKKMWSSTSTVKNWSDVRPNWPNRPIKFYSPTTNNGTFDYFTEAVNGKEKDQRQDVSMSQPTTMVRGIAGDKDAIGYFGYAYYANNKSQLKIVPVDSGTGPQIPTEDGIRTGTYKPLSRPLFIYVNKKSVAKPEVKKFVDYYLANAAKIVPSTFYVALPDNAYEMVTKRWTEMTTGTMFHGTEVGITVEELLSREAK